MKLELVVVELPRAIQSGQRVVMEVNELKCACDVGGSTTVAEPELPDVKRLETVVWLSINVQVEMR